ncbi:hypothetical protein V6N11_058604 [Hibiscus sabdariffa]|uniref:Uncharacterized protein n=1 Tax=Hibiscus sabdariffa TaxID=183260 RepID=A0ABR2U4V6_9ROSI
MDINGMNKTGGGPQIFTYSISMLCYPTPTVEGKVIQNVEVRSNIDGGNHTTTLIIEEGHDLKMQVGGDITTTSRSKQRRKKETTNKGLRIREKLEIQITLQTCDLRMAD